jgi:hypothetical protein
MANHTLTEAAVDLAYYSTVPSPTTEERQRISDVLKTALFDVCIPADIGLELADTLHCIHNFLELGQVRMDQIIAYLDPDTVETMASIIAAIDRDTTWGS